LELPLAILNSKLSDRYFRLGSTNAHVNHYQLYNLPAPHFTKNQPDKAEAAGFTAALEAQDWGQAFRLVEPLLGKAPFPGDVMTCMLRLVGRIMEVEANRGDIARTDRSALDPKAQPYQDLLDRMLYRMAGLTDAEAEALEERLDKML
jgi:hypothetical protein